EAPGWTPAGFLEAVCAGEGAPGGEHGSATKLAHAVGALLLNTSRRHGSLPEQLGERLGPLFDEDADDATLRHAELDAAVLGAGRVVAARARAGELTLPTAGPRLGALLLAGALEAPFVASLRHQAGGRAELAALASGFFPDPEPREAPRALVFTDTFEET